MTRRPPLLTLLASLAVHVGALGLLLLFDSDERTASALVIDLSELESASERPGPKDQRAGSAPTARRAAAGPNAPSPSAAKPAGARAPVDPTPSVVATPAPSTPDPPPPERDVVPVKPESRPPEPAVDAPREEAPVATARSPSVAANPPATSGQTSQTPGAGVGRGATEWPLGTTGGSASGSGTGVALAPSGPSGGTPGSEYGPYYRQIRQRIQETLEYPPAARRQGIKGTVLLELLIKPDGAISAVVKVSSSHRLLDDAALETVRNLPRQPFPPGLAPRQLTVPLPVVFDLK
jgi:periplasmic protein TonB